MSVVVDDELIFVHVVKTGGMSITKKLKDVFRDRAKLASEIQGFEDFYRQHQPSVWAVQPNPDHAPARALRSYLGDQYAKAMSFAVVRNPWSMVVSNYHFVRQTPAHPGYGRLNSMTFDEFIDAGKRTWSQIDWLSESGSVIVNHVLRFENLSDDFRKVMKDYDQLGDLEHVNATKPVDYRTLYSERTMRIVGERFQDDIAAFGYEF
jgi:Sulfotransferase family